MLKLEERAVRKIYLPSVLVAVAVIVATVVSQYFFEVLISEHIAEMIKYNIPKSEISLANILVWLRYLALFQLLMIGGYLIHLQRTRQQELAACKKRVERATFCYEAQQMLLSTNVNSFSVTATMHLIAEKLQAKLLLFAELDGKKVRGVYCWPIQEKNMLANMGEHSHIEEVYIKLCQGKTVMLDEKTVATYKEAGKLGNLPELEIENLCMVPLVRKNEGMVAVLTAFNMHGEAKILEDLIESVMMAIHNVKNYEIIQKLGTIDELTNLQNRNAYQQKLPQYEKNSKGLCCIYADANGLHDINNTYGHAAGDKMLCTIAERLREYFGATDTYRIGGDEYAAFVYDKTDVEIKTLLANFRNSLDKAGYHVAVGYAFADERYFLQHMIDEAESLMYKDKNEYYERQGKTSRSRAQINKILERSTMKESDVKMFLQVVSTKYVGVYGVNLNEDDARILLAPSHYKEILENTGYHFKDAISKYAQMFVRKDTLEAFNICYDYNLLDERIKKGINIEIYYIKNDDQMVRIKIYPMNDYSNEKRNTLWIFEKVDF